MPTKIEWCEETWNPVTGCSAISAGCKNCYARRMANRLRGRYGYPKDNPFQITYHPERFDKPRKWKKPRMIFICSMGDLFHHNVPIDWIWNVYNEIYDNPKHIFLVLTKRIDRLVEFHHMSDFLMDDPIKNLWLGVTVENPKYLWRIDELLKIPAMVRFVSIEPILAAMDIRKYLYYPPCKDGVPRSLINWVICGPETGPGRRECKPDWIRNLYDQTRFSCTPFFDKTKKNWIAREYPNEKRQ